MTESIRSALALIEQKLDCELTIASLARETGYSPWHFQRLFSREMGSTVAAYVLERRLHRAVERMGAGESGVDAALRYGFDTYAGFYKAFVKYFGCSPRAYLRLYPEHPASNDWHMLTEKELRTVLEAWPQTKNLPLETLYMPSGHPRPDAWLVGDAYMLKHSSYARIARAARLGMALEAQGFPAMRPVATAQGDLFTPGVEPFLLMNRLRGDRLDAEAYLSSQGELPFCAGQALAKLHQALRQVESDIPADECSPSAMLAEWALPEACRQAIQWQMSTTEAELSAVVNSLAALEPHLPKQLIHRDPNPSNLIFDGKAISGFADFDLSERNIRLWDICYMSTGILSEAHQPNDSRWFTVLQSILEGYHHESPLTPEEREAIWPLLCGIVLICIAAFAHNAPLHQAAATNRSMLESLFLWRPSIEKTVSSLT